MTASFAAERFFGYVLVRHSTLQHPSHSMPSTTIPICIIQAACAKLMTS
ncbi:MAG TPA: hypothetical protein V6C85_00450 [Allocoleopsis sp.]